LLGRSGNDRLILSKN
nr:Chain A, des-citrulassin F [Streptomyces avermitilis]